MLLALTGFMGSGKSTVGPLVADALGCTFIDLDHLIEEEAGCPITQIFDLEGEPGFRKIEKQVFDKTIRKYENSHAVLALGGGTVTIPGVIPVLQEKTTCIYLKANLETLQKRLTGQLLGRPLADERIALRLASREHLYEKAAHVVLETDNCSAQEVADEIIITCL